jgi:hypothetical protein
MLLRVINQNEDGCNICSQSHNKILLKTQCKTNWKIILADLTKEQQETVSFKDFGQKP